MTTAPRPKEPDMTDLTPETRAEWRKDAEHWLRVLPTKTDKLQGARVLALLDALEEAERERDLALAEGANIGIFMRCQQDPCPNAREAREQDRQGDYANEANLDYISELEKRLTEARAALARVEVEVEGYESCGPKRQCTRDVLAAIRAALRGPSDTEGQA